MWDTVQTHLAVTHMRPLCLPCISYDFGSPCMLPISIHCLQTDAGDHKRMFFFFFNYVFKRFCQYCNKKEYWKSRKHLRRGCYCWRVLREVSDMHIYTYIYISNVYLYDAVYVPISQCFRHVFNVLFMQCWIVYLNFYYVYLLCIFVLNVILIL